MRFQFFLLMGFVFLAVAFSARAGEALVPDQAKINTDDAGPVALGEFEVEFGYGMATGKHAYDTQANRFKRLRFREHTYDFSLKGGITKNAELSFGIGYADLLDKENEGAIHGHGWSDVEIGSKIRLYHSDEKSLTLSYAPSIVIPSGRESREDRLGPGGASTVLNQRMVVSKDWGRWTATADSGYGLLAGNRQGARGTWETNFGVGYQIFSWFQPVMEFHYAHDFMDSDKDADLFAITWGAVMPIHERLRVNAGVQQGLAGKNTDQTTAFSLITTVFL